MAKSMFAMQINPKDLKRLHSKLGEGAYLTAMHAVMEKASNLAERHAKQNVSVDTGALRRSINSEAKTLSARVFSNLNYAVPVERGFGPQGRPPTGKFRPPPRAFAGWARRKGLNPFAVAYTVGQRGKKGRFFMRKALVEVKKKLPWYLEQAAQYTADEWNRA